MPFYEHNDRKVSAMRVIEDLKPAGLKGKKVLVRVDFNVPLSDGTVTDDTRVRAALPTIEYLRDAGARIILMSHLGRPAGKGYEEAFSIKPAARVLSRLIGHPVATVDAVTGPEVEKAAAALADGDVLMIENVRFDAREKKNDPAMAQELADVADIYVDDAFGTAHRAHASTEGVAHLLPSYAGFLMSREVNALSNMLDDPAHPFLAILGGSKVSDKCGVIDRMIDRADAIIIGGGMCFTFLAAKGLSVGTSLLEEEWVERAGAMLDKALKAGVDILLPIDVVCADEFKESAQVCTCGIDAIPDDMMGLDIGPATWSCYREAIAKAKTVFWNGPMGVFEMKPFEGGTKVVAEALARNKSACTIIGGGDSVAAIKKFGLEGEYTFVSTGGGASMQLVEGVALPGVAALC